jgi:hypothetical protein
VIESVVELTTKLDLYSLVCDGKVLECGQVPLILAGSAIHLPRSISNVPERRRREYAGVEEAVAVSCSESELWIAGQIDSLAVSAADAPGVALKIFAILGGVLVGGLFIGFLARMLTRLLTTRPLPLLVLPAVVRKRQPPGVRRQLRILAFGE